MTRRKCDDCGRRADSSGRTLEVRACVCGRYVCLRCFQRCICPGSQTGTTRAPAGTASDPPDTAGDPAQTAGTR